MSPLLCAMQTSTNKLVIYAFSDVISLSSAMFCLVIYDLYRRINPMIDATNEYSVQRPRQQKQSVPRVRPLKRASCNLTNPFIQCLFVDAIHFSKMINGAEWKLWCLSTLSYFHNCPSAFASVFNIQFNVCAFFVCNGITTCACIKYCILLYLQCIVCFVLFCGWVYFSKSVLSLNHNLISN